MKAFKGCTNNLCIAYKKITFKDDDIYCTKCGQPLSYVCADCWMFLDDNSAKYCLGCDALRKQKREETIEKTKIGAAAIVSAVSAVGAASPKIVSGIKKVAEAGSTAAKMIKK